MTVHAEPSSHVNVSPSLSHSFLAFAQIQPLQIGDGQWNWQIRNDWCRLEAFEKTILKGVSRQWRAEAIESKSYVDYEDAYPYE